jgi:4-hydroxy-4-methyl-2-oxoglutarate aldolase
MSRDEDDQTVASLAALSCADVSDALDRLGIIGQCLGIKPLDRSFRLAGRAWTLRYGPVGADPGTVGDYIDELSSPQVVVLDNAARLDVTVWGDLLTSTAARNRLAGTVIDGVCRDIDRSIELGYPIFSRGNFMRTGKDRVRVDAVGEPVSIGGIRVEAGDWLLGDGDGVVVIPFNRLDDVLAAAVDIRDTEARIRSALERGGSLREARRQYGYHQLQSRR